MGMPRAIIPIRRTSVSWQVLHVLSTAGASILGFGLMIPMLYSGLVDCATDELPKPNPWNLPGLEWQTCVAAARRRISGLRQ
jgi:cytochrome c oxidase subunit 1